MICVDGHLVHFINNPGRRTGAIIVNNSWAGGVVDDSFLCSGSSGALAIKFKDVMLWAVCAHLDANSSGPEFMSSLDDVTFLMSQAPRGALRIVGIDAQASLHLATPENPHVGPHTHHHHSTHEWKTHHLLDHLSAWDLYAAHTFAPLDNGLWTHLPRTGIGEAKQIDFILVDKPLLRDATTDIVEMAATASDHRALLFSTFPETLTELRVPRTRQKLVGWKPTDTEAYHKQIRNKLGITSLPPKAPPNAEDTPRGTWYAATDGSWKRTNPTKAGWGFVLATPNADPDSNQEQVVYSNFGSVILDSRDGDYLGSDWASNNSGELTALAELCFYLLAMREELTLFYNDVQVAIDSKYAMFIAQGRISPKKNMYLVTLVRYLWQRVCLFYNANLVWTRGHSGNFLNEQADALAEQGRLHQRQHARALLPPASIDFAVLQPLLEQFDKNRTTVERPPGRLKET